MTKVRTQSRFSFRVRMNLSAQPLPSGARTKAGDEVVILPGIGGRGQAAMRSMVAGERYPSAECNRREL